MFATLVFIAVLSLTSCANSAGSGSGGNPQDSQLKINYALSDPPKSEQLPEESYTVIEDEDSEGIYIEFDIPESEKYWTTRVYIEGLGAVAEEVQYTDTNKTRGCFYYPFVEAGKEYTIRFVFLRDEDRDENNPDISFGHLGDDGSIGWFETKVKAGSQSKGEVRFTDKGQIDVKKNGEFKFTKKPAFQNEELLTGDNYDWEVEIGLVEGISWTHGAERRTKWHSMQETISIDNIYYTINLYKDQENEKTENKYSIDFICVRPILYYEYDGKTYKYQWDSFVREIYYPPRNPDGIYVELDLPKKEFSRCDVTIDGIGKVAERVTPLEENPARASFFYPFLEADKEYTIHFSFKDIEIPDSEGFVRYTTKNDTISEVKMNVTAGPRAKGQVRLNNDSMWATHVDDDYNLYYCYENPKFENQQLLTGNDYDWEMEIGLMEGISWTHGSERSTKWHCAVHIPKNNLDIWENPQNMPPNMKTQHNLQNLCPCEKKHDIDCICIRPIMSYKYSGTTYNYMWDGITIDVCYPPNDPNRLYGIYVELDLPKKPFSRCDVTIDGIGKVAEEVFKLDENRGCFFYPFVDPSKEYTICFSFKDIEIPDSEGFVCYTTKNDTISEVKMNVTAGSRAKGEVRLPRGNRASLRTDSKCNIMDFRKPEFENETLLGDDWMVEIGLMEGVSWNHGDERRTKWHCEVAIPKRDFDTVVNKNLRDLEMSPGDDPCEHDHDIDCICVRPIMSYEHNGKTYNYMWDGDAYDVHYPLNADFQEIDINDPADVAKIIGTWTQNEEVDYETEHSLAKVHVVWNETLVIDDTNVHNSYICTYTKANGGPFTKQEIIDEFCDDYLSNDLPDNYIDFEVGEFYNDWELEWNPNPTMYIYKIYQIHPDITLFKDWRTITDKDERTEPLSEYFENINNYEYNYFRTCELKLSKDGSQLYIFWTDKNDEYYDEWTDVYKRQ